MATRKATMEGPTLSGDKPKNKRGTTLDTMRRKLHIYLYLQQAHRTIAEIEAHLEGLDLPQVERRTLQRNLGAMENEFGIYQVNEDDGPGHAKIYAVDRAIFKDPFGFEPEVAMALALSYEQLKTTVPEDILKKVKPVFKQAAKQLERSDTPQAKWAHRVKVTPSSHVLPAAKVDQDIAARLNEYALNQLFIEIDYRNHQSADIITMQGTALGIKYRGNVGYLLLRPKNETFVRQLPYSRISRAREMLFETPQVNNFDIDEYAEAGNMAITYGEAFRLEAIIFESVRREIEDAPLGENQILSEYGSDDMYRKLEVTVPNNLDLIQWLIARAAYLKVIGPEPFKNKFNEEIRRAWKNVESDSLHVSKNRNFGG